MNQPEEEGLRRVIGVRALAANAVNLTVGAGIFGLPAVVAAYLGSASFLAYAFCALLILLIMLCLAEVGSKVTASGGLYTYIETAFGRYPGFLTNVLYWFGYCVITDAAVANLLVNNLSFFFPGLKQQVYRILIMFLIFGGLAFINVRGAKQGSSLVQIVTLIKLIPLLLLVVAGAFVVKSENLVITNWPSITSLGEVSLILFFAFGGPEVALNLSGEIKNPQRTIPRGIFYGILTIFILYVSIQLVAQGVLGDSLTLYEDAPLVEVAGRAMGPTGTTLLLVGAVISCYGLISGDVLASSRLPYAAARDGLLPAVVAKVHSTFQTPYVAVIVHTSLGFFIAVFGGFRQLAALSSSALLLIYLGVVLSTIKLRKISPGEHSFRIPGGLVIPILAIVAVLWFLSNLAANEIWTVAIYLAFFSVVYLIMNMIKKR